MNSGRAKELRKLSKDPSKSFLDELISVHGEEKVMNGDINLYKEAKRLWNKKNHKEKSKAWMY